MSKRTVQAAGTISTDAAPLTPRGLNLPALVGLFSVAGLAGYLGAVPIVDTDLWYHFAYARQMLASGSLISDHTTFSWTPSDNSVIYCAWVSQLVLYGLHEVGGLPALFVLRYALIAAVLGAVAAYAGRLGVLGHPLTWVGMLLTLLMSSAAFPIKPQLASYVLMAAVVLIWHLIRTSREASAIRLCYGLPMLMVLWVNAHGGFVVGIGFLAVAACGELLNARLSPRRTLPAAVRRHLWRALTLCAAAVILTPYGVSYPAQFLTVSLPAIDLAAVREYDSIFAASQRGLHYVEYGALMAALIAVLLATRPTGGEFEWSLVLTNVVLAGIYTYYVRLTLFWAPLALVTVVTLLAEGPRWTRPRLPNAARTLAMVSTAAMVLLSAHALRAADRSPVVGAFRGFGIGYWNPTAEAEYIARNFPAARIGNDYNSGGYLIWRLWPGQRVFMDARYFPYRSWFQEYLGLEAGDGAAALLKKYPADVWCVSLHLPRALAWFRDSSDWVPAFYGPSAAVFVRRGTPVPGGRLQAGAVDDILNLYQAVIVMAFAMDVGDFEGAHRVAKGMEQRFTGAEEVPIVARARRAVDGVLAHANGDHAKAVHLLSPIAAAYQGVPAEALLRSASLEATRFWQSGDLPSALSAARVAAAVSPQSPLAAYNAGAIGWWIARQSAGSPDGQWRTDFEVFIRLAPPRDAGLATALVAARAMLDGRASARPFLLAPPALRQGRAIP